MGVLIQNEQVVGGLDAAVAAKIGTATLTTSASDLSGAINEHETDITGINNSITTINSSLTDLTNKKIIREKLTLSSDSSGFALTTFTTSGYQILSASGKGFGCLPFDGGAGYWYIVFLNLQTFAKYPNLSNKDIWITYQVL